MAAELSKDRCNGQTLGYVTCPERPAPNQRFVYFPFVFELVGKGSIMQPQLWKWKLKRNQILLLHTTDLIVLTQYGGSPSFPKLP